MKCNSCGKDEELRLGTCFDCARNGEEKASKRTVAEHIVKGLSNLRKGRYEYAKYDFSWAFQRLTKTGDYSKGGTFDFEGYDWRSVNPPQS